MRLSEAQRKLLTEIAKNNADGISPSIPPLYDQQRNALVERGLITTLCGFARLTTTGREVLVLLVVLFVAACTPPSAAIAELCADGPCRLATPEEGRQISASAAESRRAAAREEQRQLEAVSDAAGCEPKLAYVLRLKLKQSRMSLDIGKHIKDAVNAVEFELPVSRELYNQVSVGSQLLDNLRVGSLLLRGSFSNWRITVTSKRIEKMGATP